MNQLLQKGFCHEISIGINQNNNSKYNLVWNEIITWTCFQRHIKTLVQYAITLEITDTFSKKCGKKSWLFQTIEKNRRFPPCFCLLMIKWNFLSTNAHSTWTELKGDQKNFNSYWIMKLEYVILRFIIVLRN